MSAIQPMPADLAPMARTNMLQLVDGPLELIRKLATRLGRAAHLNFGTTQVPREKGERLDTYYRKVDAQIKTGRPRKLSATPDFSVRCCRYDLLRTQH